MPKNDLSRKLFDRARRSIPGGVNSPVRAFGSVGGDPLFIIRSEGARIWDADGNAYLDFVGSWGPMILGHNQDGIKRAVYEALKEGTSFGAPTTGEIELAELVVEMVPSVEVVRMVNSGTEATMSAVRLARAATGRPKMIKFRGGVSWPRRRLPGRGRIGSRHPWGALQPRGHGRGRCRHPGGGFQRPGIGPGAF